MKIDVWLTDADLRELIAKALEEKGRCRVVDRDQDITFSAEELTSDFFSGTRTSVACRVEMEG